MGELKSAQEADIDLAPVLKAIREKGKPEEAKLKEMSQVSRLYLGMWESLTQDDSGLLRLKMIFTNVPFHGNVLILPWKLVREVILTAHQQAAHKAAKETVRR